MNKNLMTIICASIGAIAIIGAAVIGLIGKNQPGIKIVVQPQTSPSEGSPQPQSVPDNKKGKASLSSKMPRSMHPSTDKTETPQQPQRKDWDKHPLSLYCACRANQTFCFRTETECQTFSPVYGCSQKFSDGDAFAVFDRSKWKEYGNGWVNESKCVTNERRN